MIPGVREVIVNIDVVAVQALDDAELGLALQNTLSWAAYLPGDAVHARVKDSWVLLSGTVHWAFQRQNAEDAVRFFVANLRTGSVG